MCGIASLRDLHPSLLTYLTLTMNFSKTHKYVVEGLVQFVTSTFNNDFDEIVENNKETVIRILQTVNDFDLEPLVHTTFFTLFLVGDSEQEEHVLKVKDWVFNVLSETNQNYYMDVEKFFEEGSLDPVEEVTNENNNFIDDDVYGEVDPEDIEHLKSCYSM